MAKIAIIGPGAVGSVVAALLHRAGRHEIVLCARRPVAELVVDTIEGTVRFAPRVLTDPQAAAAVDWVFVTTKAYDASSAAGWLPRLIANGAPVAILQNGIEHRERFAGCAPADRLVPVMVDCPAERGEAKVIQRGPARLVVQDDGPGAEFVDLFAGTTVLASVTADLKSALWRKLCVNAAGVVSAIVDEPAGVMRSEAAAELARAIVREVIAVGRAEGAALSDDLVQAVIDGYRNAPVDAINSLHADCRAGRPTEIDARNGVVVRLGRTHGMAAPYNDMAVKLVTVLGRKDSKPPR